jgi:hypothetical protein
MRGRVLLALVLGVGGCAAQRAAQGSSEPVHAIDHLVVGAPQLDAAVALVAERTGVTAAPGGAHPGRGTHNALMSIGEGSYLELVAPVPGAELTGDLADFARLTGPTPLAFAIRSSDLVATRERLKADGLVVSEIVAGSRQRPDGTMLRWRVFELNEADFPHGPFFIQWDPGSQHPSVSSPAGCRIAQLELRAPNVEPVARLLKNLGVDVPARVAAMPALSLTLHCPKGELTLGPGD